MLSPGVPELLITRPRAVFDLKNALFAGHDAGADNWAIESCKLNSVDRLLYLTFALTAIVNEYKRRRIETLTVELCGGLMPAVRPRLVNPLAPTTQSAA